MDIDLAAASVTVSVASLAIWLAPDWLLKWVALATAVRQFRGTADGAMRPSDVWLGGHAPCESREAGLPHVDPTAELPEDIGVV